MTRRIFYTIAIIIICLSISIPVISDTGNNYALHFDGVNDWVLVSDNASLNPSGSFSVDIYCRVDLDISQGCTLASKYIGSNKYWQLYFYSDGRGLQWHYHNGSGYYEIYNTDGGKITLSEWHHVVGIWNQSTTTLSMYVDGELAGTDSVITSSPQTKSSDMLKIGGWNDGTREYKGRLDEFRYYSRALTEDEVEYLYNYGDGIEEPTISDMIVGFHMNENIGDKIYGWNAGFTGNITDATWCDGYPFFNAGETLENFSVVRTGVNTCNVSWDETAGYDLTHVRVRTDRYPYSFIDGYSVFTSDNDSSPNWVEVSGLELDRGTYYFSGWKYYNGSWGLSYVTAKIGGDFMYLIAYAAILLIFILIRMFNKGWLADLALVAVCIFCIVATQELDLSWSNWLTLSLTMILLMPVISIIKRISKKA